MAVQYYNIILKNVTDSDITIPDLSGLTIPASGTSDVTEIFPFHRLVMSEDIDDYITSSGVVLNVQGYDLTAADATVFLSHHNATHIQGVPIGDGNRVSSSATLSGGQVIEYDADNRQFNFKPYDLKSLNDVTLNPDGTYNVEGTTAAAVDFINLTDTPTTYSGLTDYTVKVNANSDGLVFSSVANANIISSYYPPASGTSNVWYNLNDNGFYYYDDERYKWLSVNTHTFLYTYNAAISAAYLSVGTVATNFAHYGIRRAACITAIIAHGDTGYPTKGFDILDAATDPETVVKTFYLSNYIYENVAENIDIENNSELKIFVHQEGQGVKYPIVQIEIKWRYEYI